MVRRSGKLFFRGQCSILQFVWISNVGPTMSQLSSAIKQSSGDINVQTLQRLDPGVVNIRYTAKFAVAYQLDAVSAWVKMGIEGSLFLVDRESAPLYALRLLNRTAINRDLDAPITASMQVDRSQDKCVIGWRGFRLPIQFGCTCRWADSVAWILCVSSAFWPCAPRRR